MDTEPKLIEYKVSGLSNHKSGFFRRGLKKNDEYLMVLEQVDNPSQWISMVVGEFEAQQLAVAVEDVKPTRPLINDLLKVIINELGFTLSKVVVNKLEDGIFYSSMYLTKGDETKIIDSRPADAITQAVKFNCKIYFSTEVIDKNNNAR